MSETTEEIDFVRKMVEEHTTWRSQCLNLIASENALSPATRRALDNDWVGRYADFTERDLDARRYRGTRYITEIEKTVEKLAKRVFRADYVEFRPIGGHLAGAAVLMGLCQPGDVILELGSSSGGHREATKTDLPKLIDLEVQFLPFDAEHYNIDVPETARLIAETKPRLVILGSSNFLFPHPVREIKNILQQTCPNGILVYDASHVLGLLAGRNFQDPLAEGADVVYSSTHKTFPGPQGGIVFTNRGDLIEAISQAVYPALVTNHHAFRMPALATALAEMETFGEEYAHKICNNAQALGSALEAAGVACIQVDGIYSRSHTVLAKVAQFGRGPKIALQLEEADIICTGTSLPEFHGSEGIRLGVQELTHHGASEAEMVAAAKLISDVICARRPVKDVAADVNALAGKLESIKFTW